MAESGVTRGGGGRAGAKCARDANGDAAGDGERTYVSPAREDGNGCAGAKCACDADGDAGGNGERTTNVSSALRDRNGCACGNDARNDEKCARSKNDRGDERQGAMFDGWARGNS